MRSAAIVITAASLFGTIGPACADEGVLARLRGVFDGAVSQANALAAQRRDTARAVRDLMAESARTAGAALEGPAAFEALALPAPLPAQQARLAQFGASGPLDELQAQARAAAAAAALAAANVLHAEAERVELTDPAGLIAAAPGSAAQHLWVRCEEQITQAAQAQARAALEQTEAWAALERLGESWAAAAARDAAREALARHVAEQALAALLAELKAQEAAIRADPSRRTTPALAATFGAPA